MPEWVRWTHLLDKPNSFFQDSKFGIVVDLLVEKCKHILLCFKISITSKRVVSCQNLEKNKHKLFVQKNRQQKYDGLEINEDGVKKKKKNPE